MKYIMSEMKVNTAGIPTHISDDICSTLLSSIKAYINRPGVAEELQRRGEEYLRRKAERAAMEQAQAVV